MPQWTKGYVVFQNLTIFITDNKFNQVCFTVTTIDLLFILFLGLAKIILYIEP